MPKRGATRQPWCGTPARRAGAPPTFLWRLSFTVSESWPSPPPLTVPPGRVTNAVAAMSRLLITPDLADFAPGEPLFVYANSPCGQSTYGACYEAGVSTGPWTGPYGAPGPLRYKYVLTQEAGHGIHELADSKPKSD